MKKGITFILLIVFLVLIGINVASAWGYWGFFAGKVTHMKAVKVEEAENAGLKCDVGDGETFSITLMGSPSGTPTDFAVGSRGRLATRSGPSLYKKTIGRYEGEREVTCKKPTEDKKKEEVISFSLTTISGQYGFSGF